MMVNTLPTHLHQPGAVLQGRYQLERVLGRGGMGTTYKAFDRHTKRPVAVKVLHFSGLRGWKTLELFERETAVLKQLKHPQIPAYLDYHVAESASDVQFMLIQEYIEGNSLQQLVEKGWRGTETEILAIFWQAADILEYLHTLSPPVIHRDISPKNLLLSPTKTVYLVDFGAVQDRVRTTLRGGTTIVGTFGYMPFEQFQGQTVPASDYYALGATLLYLLTHRYPEDFPKDDLVIRFQPYLHASAPMTRLLAGLLEPAAENRLHSPEQLHAIFTEQAGKLSKRALKPPNTKITRKVHRGNRLTFRLPLRESFKALALWGLGVFFLMASIRATYELLIEVIESGTLGILLAFPLIMLPFGIIGAKLFLSNTYRAFGKPVLELSPEGIAITVACFGRRRPKKAERIPISDPFPERHRHDLSFRNVPVLVDFSNKSVHGSSCTGTIRRDRIVDPHVGNIKRDRLQNGKIHCLNGIIDFVILAFFAARVEDISFIL